jgi:hypothetical protein
VFGRALFVQPLQIHPLFGNQGITPLTVAGDPATLYRWETATCQFML